MLVFDYNHLRFRLEDSYGQKIMFYFWMVDVPNESRSTTFLQAEDTFIPSISLSKLN